MISLKFKKFSAKVSDYSNFDLLIIHNNHDKAKKLFSVGKKTGFQVTKNGFPIIVTENEPHKEVAKYSDFTNIAVFSESKNLSEATNIALSGYKFSKYKSEKSKEKRKVTVFGLSSTEVSKANRAAESIAFARDLVNTPASDLSPKHLASIAKKLGKPVTTKVYTKAELKKLKCGGILAVSQGSTVDPCLIHLKCGSSKAKHNITLIGKGVTFDSGGYSLKPPQGMEDMKIDMAGAAAVMGLFHNLTKLGKLPKNVCIHGLIPCAENMVNSKAQKPGDVYKAMDGTTVEVLNTDAEGRLLLADAICFAQTKLESSHIVTLATLTGAAIMALGDDYAALFGNDDKFTSRVKAAAEAEDELLWELPLAKKYVSKLDSKVADIKNNPGKPGAITAALFLEHFVKKGTNWCHVDLAGPSFISGIATGYGVKTLSNLIQTNT